MASQVNVPNMREDLITVLKLLSNLVEEGILQDFPGGPVVKNPPGNAEDTGLILGLGRFHIP